MNVNLSAPPLNLKDNCSSYSNSCTKISMSSFFIHCGFFLLFSQIIDFNGLFPLYSSFTSMGSINPKALVRNWNTS